MTHQYLSKRQLTDQYSISLRTVDKAVRQIRDLIGIRYPANSVTRFGQIIRIRADVFNDLMTYGDRIENETAPEFKGGNRYENQMV
jgi:hypothetical protein